jgi:hypothetical protein
MIHSLQALRALRSVICSWFKQPSDDGGSEFLKCTKVDLDRHGSTENGEHPGYLICFLGKIMLIDADGIDPKPYRSPRVAERYQGFFDARQYAEGLSIAYDRVQGPSVSPAV